MWRVTLGSLATVLVLALTPGVGRTGEPVVPPRLLQRALAEGAIRVVVQLASTAVPEGHLPHGGAVSAQRQGIASAQALVAATLQGTAHRIVHQYQTIPFLALEASWDALRVLETLRASVASVQEDLHWRPLLAESVPLVATPPAWSAGFDGTGTIIGVLDTGVDKAHPFLAGKIVEEACYSSSTSRSLTLCPSGQDTQVGPGAGVNCPLSLPGCDHGTHVAGIAAGNGAGAGVAFSGVARGAELMAVQVFAEFFTSADCAPDPAPCIRAWFSDVVAGLDRVFVVSALHNIVAVNMSLGGGRFTSPCDASLPAVKAAIDNLRSVGIASVVASGNDGFVDAINAPACISTAVSVGSTDDGSFGTTADTVSIFTNSASFLSLLAPGRWINSSVPGGEFANFQGTSMATPHVAGAFAILSQKEPTASVGQMLSALQATGVPVFDPGNGLTKPRIRVVDALASLQPPLVVQSLTADKASPQPAPVMVTWTAVATGGAPPLQYQFFLRTETSGFQVVRAWGSSASVTLTLSAPGTYYAAVWVRSAGGSAPEAGAISAPFVVGP